MTTDSDAVFCIDCGALIDSATLGCSCRRPDEIAKELGVVRGLVDHAVTELLRAQLRLSAVVRDPSDPLRRRLAHVYEHVADLRDSI